MRTLKFIVDNQILKKDPNCSFEDLVPGSVGYLKVEFSFSPEWDGFAKVVGFYSALGKEYPPQVLKDGRTCIIPSEALQKRAFRIVVVGKKGGLKLNTNELVIYQNGD